VSEDEELPTYQERSPRGALGAAGRLARGTRVADYVIDDEIGRGGMGFVYSATHAVIGKRAAIKVLKPEVSRSHIIVERFIQEARAVNAIHHPNIIDIFAFGALDDGRAYHIMDLLSGESLRARLKRGPLPAGEASSILDETALALAAAHDKGFVHRDLKPDNIYLQPREGFPEVKLLDFGLAKLMPEAGIAPFQTKTGTMLGTPEYMAPEQARGQSADYRTDIYALGIVTFEMLAGRRPFASLGDAYATLMAHADEPAPALRDLLLPDAAVPDELARLVDALLAKDPMARPSLAAVRSVIKRLRASPPPPTPVPELRAATTPMLVPQPPVLRPSGPSLPPQSLHPPAASTHGGRGALAGGTHPTAPPAPAPLHGIWYVVGAALAIGAGIGLALLVT
jgi:eukaryotic-like serine/threonine-protein kinase